MYNEIVRPPRFNEYLHVNNKDVYVQAQDTRKTYKLGPGYNIVNRGIRKNIIPFVNIHFSIKYGYGEL